MSKPYFVVTLKLQTEPWQQDVLLIRFELARILYNTMTSYARKRLDLMSQSKDYRSALRAYKHVSTKLSHTKDKKHTKTLEAEKKNVQKQLDGIRLSFGLSEYSFHAYIKKHQRNYKTHIDSHVAQKIATNVWQAVCNVLFGKGKTLHFKKFGTLTSIEGKQYTAGIRFKNHTVYWNGLTMPVVYRKNDLFIQEALSASPLKYCRLLKRTIRGREVFYVQLVLEGFPPAKRIHSTGGFRFLPTSIGRVGLDIGTSTIAVVSETAVLLRPLGQTDLKTERELKRLSRKLDRSRRSNNSGNYNTDGTVKRGIRLKWVRSKTYQKTLSRLQELKRYMAVRRKEHHASLANTIVTLGNEMYVETMRFQGLAKRAKGTKTNRNGKFQSKKRYGKSIGQHAPTLLLEQIKQKLQYVEGNLHKINTHTFKASQYNHSNDQYKKKKLSQRWTSVDHRNIQRDLYSAFLLMNSDDTHANADRKRCLRTFEAFVSLHDQEIQRIKENERTIPSSMGI